jgi:molybdopterin converting factor small subunit
MKIKVRFFAILRERAGAAEITRDIGDGSTVADLWQALQQDFPKLNVAGIRLLYAVVFIPPVSGG